MRRAIRLSVAIGLVMVLFSSAASVATDDNADYAWSIDVLDPAPAPDATEVVVVRLWSSDDGNSPLPQITVCSRWYFGTTISRRICGITNSDGEVRLSYIITGVMSGDTVAVTLSALRSYDWRDLGSVSFVLQ